jgi:ABC-type bacteriocin/lantibiotic exporter with double-glycine peptidase domain
MAFCSTGFSKAKQFLSQIDGTLETIIEKTTDYTAKIKAIEGTLTVAAIVAAVPVASEVEGYINKGLDVIIGVEQGAKSLAEKLATWLDGKTEADKNGSLVKLASVATAIAHDNQHTESFYDTAVQTHVYGLK